MNYLFHLARRFFGSFGTRRPRPSDQLLVAEALTRSESEIFWLQPVADIDHALRGARLLHAGERPELVGSFLLHDVGKRHARLGPIGRSFATVLRMVGVPVRGRYAAYLSHGDIGARELTDLGCSPLAVSFSRHHHGPVPDGIEADAWAALVAADHA